MYKLKHRLFGWDYILWDDCFGRGIARVFFLPDGKMCYWKYRELQVIAFIKNRNDVTWLTCTPDKYGL